MAARRFPKPGEFDLLVVTYGGGHVQAVLPVVKHLHAKGVSVVVFALTTAISVLQNTNIPYFTYADLPHASDPEICASALELMTQMPRGGPLPEEETSAYIGINQAELQQTLGNSAAADLWQTGGRQHFYPLRTMQEVLRLLRPKLVMATNSPRSEKAAIDAAGTLGIPAVCLVDLFALHAVRWLAQPDFAQKLYVLDESVKQMFVQKGRPAQDILVTGNPAFDSIHDPVVQSNAIEMRKMRRWGLDGRITLLYASTPEPKLHPFTGLPADPDLPLALERHLRNITRNDQRLELVIRRHPSEDPNIEVEERIFASPRSDDVNALVQAVDLVVVTSSTVGLQAYLAGTQVLSVESSVFSKDVPLGDFGMSVAVPDFGGIEAAIGNLYMSLVSKRTRSRGARVLTGAKELIANDIEGRLK